MPGIRRDPLRQVAFWAAIVVGGFLVWLSNNLKHRPLALKVFDIAYGVVALLSIVFWGIWGALSARDWLWLRRDDWRKSRQGG